MKHGTFEAGGCSIRNIPTHLPKTTKKHTKNLLAWKVRIKIIFPQSTTLQVVFWALEIVEEIKSYVFTSIDVQDLNTSEVQTVNKSLIGPTSVKHARHIVEKSKLVDIARE